MTDNDDRPSPDALLEAAMQEQRAQEVDIHRLLPDREAEAAGRDKNILKRVGLRVGLRGSLAQTNENQAGCHLRSRPNRPDPAPHCPSAFRRDLVLAIGQAERHP